ncbi:flavodoxin domain-containing protein [Loigolactobacillus binensis]|uniref:Flavodoxin domain-containing protein n=1 Tax=Loigolactobacillus binensis TaxID=2559922 RepID=A0ABW3EBP2_9LACO|nr:flavodoxin domain-containing protein [Loigolactobacillus binensis]
MKIKIIYTSLTGNTQEAVAVLSAALTALAAQVEVFDSEDGIEVADFFNDADAYVLASFTDEDGQLPDGILDFYDDLTDFDLTDIPVAVLGTGDTTYADFCRAVDVLTDQCQEDGAQLAVPSLKIELAPDAAATQEIKRFARQLTQQIAA